MLNYHAVGVLRVLLLKYFFNRTPLCFLGIYKALLRPYWGNHKSTLIFLMINNSLFLKTFENVHTLGFNNDIIMQKKVYIYIYIYIYIYESVEGL